MFPPDAWLAARRSPTILVKPLRRLFSCPQLGLATTTQLLPPVGLVSLCCAYAASNTGGAPSFRSALSASMTPLSELPPLLVLPSCVSKDLFCFGLVLGSRTGLKLSGADGLSSWNDSLVAPLTPPIEPMMTGLCLSLSR